MTSDDLARVDWLPPWHSCPAGAEIELAKECGRGHPLFGRRAISVGRRHDNDDVLFLLPDGPQPLAVVHLTWTGKRETKPEWPHTAFYSSLDDWIERGMKADHLERNG